MVGLGWEVLHRHIHAHYTVSLYESGSLLLVLSSISS